MMQDPKSLLLGWRTFSGCRRARMSIHFDHWGSQYIENELWCPDVNILWSTVLYLNATIYGKPKTRNRRLEPTDLAKPGETRRFIGMGVGLARQELEGRVSGRIWNRSDPFFWSKPGPLAGYPDLLLTLPATPTHRHTTLPWADLDSELF